MPRGKDAEPSGINIAELRQNLAELVAKNAVSMVQHAIDGVIEDGQYQAIKYLFELVGIYPPIAGGEQQPEDTLSRVLLRQLGIEVDELPGKEPVEHPVK